MCWEATVNFYIFQMQSHYSRIFLGGLGDSKANRERDLTHILFGSPMVEGY
jgi:hypothetical protein